MEEVEHGSVEQAPSEQVDALSPVALGGGVVLFVVLLIGGIYAVVRGSRMQALPGPFDGPVAQREASVEASSDPVEPAGPSLVQRLSGALGRSRAALQERFDTIFGGEQVDEALYEALEEALLRADVGMPTTQRLVDRVRAQAETEAELPALRETLRQGIREILHSVHKPLEPFPADGPLVILVVGVNGSGKTTTIGKLAARFTAAGKRVMIAAADTYRAAAAEQLAVWAERAGADIVRHDEGADPGAVVYATLESALAKGHDVVLIDTAGRLQTTKPLMEQLTKIRRVIGKLVPDGPHETLLVLDGTMGQNGLSQARLFHQATPLTGAAVTKLDGTAKGGMILTLAAELDLPIKLIGIGEQVDDLRDFEPEPFAEVLA